MNLRMNRLVALPEGAGLPRRYWYLVADDGGTIKVPGLGPGGEQLIAVLAFTRRDLAGDYLRPWLGSPDFPAGARARRLRRSDPEARGMARAVWVEAPEGRRRARIRLAIDARGGAERGWPSGGGTRMLPVMLRWDGRDEHVE